MSKPTQQDPTIDENELFPIKQTVYGSDYKEHLLEQYSLYVHMADNISSRRAIANTFFLSINIVLIAIIGILSSEAPVNLILFRSWTIVVAIAALCVSWTWRALIQSYKELNTAKFKVIHAIERRLPAAGYAAEWSFLTGNLRKKRYRVLTQPESWVPKVFIAIYLVLILLAAADLVIPFLS